MIFDWNTFDPLKLGLALAVTLRAQYPTEWKPEGILKMLGNRASYKAILAGQDWREIEKLWRSELEQFQQIRARYLIYHQDRE